MRNFTLVVLTLFSGISYAQAPLFITSSNRDPFYEESVAGSRVLVHSSGLSMTLPFPPVSVSEVGKECSRMSAETGEKWIVPNHRDIMPFGDMHERIYKSLREDFNIRNSVELWYSARIGIDYAIPQLVDYTKPGFKNIPAYYVKSQYAYSVFDPTPGDRYGVRTADTERPYICVALRTADLSKMKSVKLNVQAKGYVELQNRRFVLKPYLKFQPTTAISSGGTYVQLFSIDGKTHFGSVPAEPKPYYLPQPRLPGASISLNPNEVEYTPYPAGAVIQGYQDAVYIEGDSEILTALSRTRELVNINGQFDTASKAIRASKLERSGLVNVPPFFVCHAETTHFKTTKQGCAFFKTPGNNGQIIFAHRPSDLSDPDRRSDASSFEGQRLPNSSKYTVFSSKNEVFEFTTTKVPLSGNLSGGRIQCGRSGGGFFCQEEPLFYALPDEGLSASMAKAGNAPLSFPFNSALGQATLQQEYQKNVKAIYPANFAFELITFQESDFYRSYGDEFRHAAFASRRNSNSERYIPQYDTSGVLDFDRILYPMQKTIKLTDRTARFYDSREKRERVLPVITQELLPYTRGGVAGRSVKIVDPLLPSVRAVTTEFNHFLSNVIPTERLFEPAVGEPKNNECLYTNAVDHADVNRDGFVTALDALTIIHYLNGLSAGVQNCNASLALDVNGNGTISAADALEVIHEIRIRELAN